MFVLVTKYYFLRRERNFILTRSWTEIKEFLCFSFVIDLLKAWIDSEFLIYVLSLFH